MPVSPALRPRAPNAGGVVGVGRRPRERATRLLWTPAYVAIGSNLDDPSAQVEGAFVALRSLPESRLIARSRLYRFSAARSARSAGVRQCGGRFADPPHASCDVASVEADRSGHGPRAADRSLGAAPHRSRFARSRRARFSRSESLDPASSRRACRATSSCILCAISRRRCSCQVAGESAIWRCA